MSSEAHRNALLKVLNESYFPNNTEPQELEQTVGQVLATNIITSTEDELIKDGTGHIKSAHNCGMQRHDCREPVLNVCTLVIIDRLGVDHSSIRENEMMGRSTFPRAQP